MKTTYETDFYGWTREQSKALANRDMDKMDYNNLIEELEDLANSKERALESHITNLLMHMLKVQYQPEMRTRSWDLTIKNSKLKAIRLLKKNPGMKNELHQIKNDAYESARLEAAKETGLDEEVFPEECPWTIEEVLKQGS